MQAGPSPARSTPAPPRPGDSTAAALTPPGSMLPASPTREISNNVNNTCRVGVHRDVIAGQSPYRDVAAPTPPAQPPEERPVKQRPRRDITRSDQVIDRSILPLSDFVHRSDHPLDILLRPASCLRAYRPGHHYCYRCRFPESTRPPKMADRALDALNMQSTPSANCACARCELQDRALKSCKSQVLRVSSQILLDPTS